MKLLKLDFFEGKKTYIVSFLLVAYAITGFLTGNMELERVIELLGLGSLGATLRKAM
ncbi:MAG: hypothetical protein AABY22_21415 [Nanoarchaeota archaeon]